MSEQPATEHMVLPDELYGPCRTCGKTIRWSAGAKRWLHDEKAAARDPEAVDDIYDDADAACWRSFRDFIDSVPEFYRVGFVRTPLGLTVVALDPQHGQPFATLNAPTLEHVFAQPITFAALASQPAAAEGLDVDHVHIVPLGYGDHEATEGDTYSLVQCRECGGMVAVAPGARAALREDADARLAAPRAAARDPDRRHRLPALPR